ncbi:hypothetical protein [Rhodococcoides kyotonense]|uniref:hypothetical protein n=1 Tax=Rhodococcoides kyotonense TaxID=398843 RepID=UPI00113199A2|nr:hypothetical protein [Rhodococcus kyotonensis]
MPATTVLVDSPLWPTYAYLSLALIALVAAIVLAATSLVVRAGAAAVACVVAAAMGLLRYRRLR